MKKILLLLNDGQPGSLGTETGPIKDYQFDLVTNYDVLKEKLNACSSDDKEIPYYGIIILCELKWEESGKNL
jgi:hypothetical protein